MVKIGHVVPAWTFGHQLQCLQNGGRKNCKKTSEKFRLMEAGLRNLVPSIGEINGNRSNYSFAMLEGEERVYGACDFEVDFKGRKAEPAESVRGDIARIYFYMQDQYGVSAASSASYSRCGLEPTQSMSGSANGVGVSMRC